MTGNTRPPHACNTFLQCNENKTERFICSRQNTDSSIVVTKEENVASNKVIAPCNHEEADTHMFLHAKHVLVKGVVVYDEALDHIWKRQ